MFASAELTLALSDLSIDRSGETSRCAATAELIFVATHEVRSPRFRLVAPIGPIEAEDLRWYLESYVRWPSGVFVERARDVEAALPRWGRLLHEAAFEHEAAREVYQAWRRSGDQAIGRLTILVDNSQAAPGLASAPADMAAALFLGLPWELLHDNAGYVFLRNRPVRIRRALPNLKTKVPAMTEAPLRVLLVSPRPEDGSASYLDHRIGARPVVEALAFLGELAKLTLLSPPTFPALRNELAEARRHGVPYHVVHFDGHGVYSDEIGSGALCFEHPEDSDKLEYRRSDIILAEALAELMRDQRVPLFYLDACETAVAREDPTASVAGTLLQRGAASVVAMTHSVLLETARRFVSTFYSELVAGRSIGEAMSAGQRDLQAHPIRYRTFHGDLHLEDWFVHVLYQEEVDPCLIEAGLPQPAQDAMATERRQSLGELPPAPVHGFIGRSRELLQAERLLETQRYVVLRGEGGEGKTALAAELARWLVATRRFERAAFVSLEQLSDVRALLFTFGQQLVVDFASHAGQDDFRGWLELERALRERRTILVFDNMESILPPEPGALGLNAFEAEVLQTVLAFASQLQSTGQTRLVFTTRQELPPPYTDNHIVIGRLERAEAIDVVARVLGQEERAPLADDPGDATMSWPGWSTPSAVMHAVSCWWAARSRNRVSATPPRDWGN